MPHTVLVVEDNANIRRFIRTTLGLEGYRVLEASTVQDGLDVARREQPDLVLLDLALPDGTGWDFLQSITPSAEGFRESVIARSVRDKSHPPACVRQLSSRLEHCNEKGPFSFCRPMPALECHFVT